MAKMNLSIGRVTLRKWGNVIRRETYLESDSVVRSLCAIKAESREQHTKDNIQDLIDMVHELKPTL